MGKVRSTLTLIVSLAVLGAFALIFQQYTSYLKYRSTLAQSDSQNRQRLKQIEQVLLKQESFSEQLAETSQRYTDLRQQLPAELQLESFKQQVEKMFSAAGLKVLAQREARYNRPFYHEVRLAYSVKGSATKVKRTLGKLKKLPRLILSKGPEKESDENVGLELRIFSVPVEDEPTPVSPQCLAAPQGIWFPLLEAELEQLYADYDRTCRTLAQNSALHADMQRYRYLSEKVLYFEAIRDSISNIQ